MLLYTLPDRYPGEDLMASKSARSIPPLYWFVDDENRPLALDLRGGAKVFCFFGSRLNAEAFKRVLEDPADWILLGNKSPNYLIELCERASQEGYTDFALDPPPNYGGWFPRWTLEEFKGVIERSAAGEQGR
jgi:hypothetical protein